MRPWTTNQLKRLGECIRDGRELPSSLPDYDEVMSWYNDQAAMVQREIESIDLAHILGDSAATVEITSRAKTIDTLREKLIRDHGMALPSIQDVAGVRLDASMVLSQQDEVAAAIADHFGQDLRAAITDLRASPHSGYRAVHVILRLESRVEVQVRTVLQSEWANAYEALGDRFGRGIRYGEPPTDREMEGSVNEMQSLSVTTFAEMERRHDAVFLRNRAELSKYPYPDKGTGPVVPPAVRQRAIEARRAFNSDEQRRKRVEADLQQRLRTLSESLRRSVEEGGL